MNKLLNVAVATGLAVVSASSFAASSHGGFFVNAGVGQAQYHVGRTDGLGYKLDDKDTTSAVRFGYAWRSAVDFGVEAGYVDLGKLVAKYDDGVSYFHDDLHASGWMLGVNGTYRFESPWYVEARGGLLRSTIEEKFRLDSPTYTDYYGADATGDGWYAGVGAGYDFSNDLSMGVHYDNYHVKATLDGSRIRGSVSAFSVQFEYRF